MFSERNASINEKLIYNKLFAMKYLTIVCLLLVLGCQQKRSTDIKNQNHTPDSTFTLGRDTIQNIKICKSDVNDNISNKLPKQRKQNSADADADFQQEANEKLSKLLEHYGKDTPDYYGGGFIDEKGNLVINIKGKFEDGKTKVIDIIGSANIRFKSTKYSNKELIAIMDYLNDFAQKSENKKLIINLSGWSQMENYVEVCFKKMDKNSEADFRKYILDSEAVRFKECGEIRF